MSSSPDRLVDLLEALLDDATPPARRGAIEVELAADPGGRRVLDAVLALRRPLELEPPMGLAATLLAGLPELGPGSREALAKLVLDAWLDAGLAEALRRDPAAVLASRGLRFPAGLAVVTVAPGEAQLPRRDRLVIPLPVARGRALTAGEARRALFATELGWLWGPPWSRDDRGEAALGSRAAVRGWRRLGRPAVAVLVAALVLSWLALSFPVGSDLSGWAGEPAGEIGPAAGGTALLVWAAVGLGVAALALWAWRRRS